MYSRIHGNVRLVVYTYTQMAKDQVINVRVSVEEKATLKKAAGAGGIGPYLRALGLAQANGVGPRTSSVPQSASSSAEGIADSGSEGWDSAAKSFHPRTPTGDPNLDGASPARSWKSRVNQLQAQGVPRPAAERIADLELQGVR